MGSERLGDPEGVWVLLILRTVGSSEGFKQQVMIPDVALGKITSSAWPRMD